jgi:tetratricopeptide (TPR) repeat protein
LIDTPGFDDSGRSDADILETISDYLRAAYTQKIYLTGVIYVQRITDNRMQGSSLRCLRLLKKLCGPEYYGNIVLVTTMWDNITRGEGEERENNLRNVDAYWGELLRHGATFQRHFPRGNASALKVITHLLEKTPAVLNFQRELFKAHGVIADASAGQILTLFYAKKLEETQERTNKVLKELEESEAVTKKAKEELERSRKEREALEEQVKRERESLQAQLKRERESLEADVKKEREGLEAAMTTGKARGTLEDHSDEVTSVLRGQGKYKQAEEMNRRALEGYEKALGKEHPATLTSVSNLALVLRNQGKYEQAEEMNRRALEGREKALGKVHPDTLTSVSTLASVLRDQGKYKQAEEMNRRALEGYEKALGKEHPNTLASVNHLGEILLVQGRYELGEEMNRRAFKGRQKALGSNHSDTLRSLTNLTYALRSQERWREAEELQTQAADVGGVPNLGLDHSSLDLDSDTGPINITGNGDTLSGESSSASFVWSGQPSTTTVPSSFPLASVPDSKGATSLGHLAKKSDAHQDSDIQSVVSVDEDILSTVESNSASEARQAAGDYLVGKFTNDGELRTLYQKAMQGLEEARFIRNNRRLLKLYFLDLNSEGQTPSDKLATKFLRPRSERIRISNKICRFLMPSENSVRDRIDDKLRIERVGLYLANQRLVLENSATAVANQLVDQEGMDNTDATSETSEGSNDSANTENEESIDETSTELVHAELEAAAKFLTSGWPFRLYKERLRSFLYQQCRPKEVLTQRIEQLELTDAQGIMRTKGFLQSQFVEPEADFEDQPDQNEPNADEKELDVGNQEELPDLVAVDGFLTSRHAMDKLRTSIREFVEPSVDAEKEVIDPANNIESFIAQGKEERPLAISNNKEGGLEEDNFKRRDESTCDPDPRADTKSDASEETLSSQDDQQAWIELAQEIISTFIATLGGLCYAPFSSLASYRGEQPLQPGKRRVRWTCVSSPIEILDFSVFR